MTRTDTPYRWKVYICDDDEGVRRSLSLLLSESGYANQCFESGEEFLAQCNRGMRGCVVLDLRMPGMDGLEVQQELLARGITLPVIMVTAHGDVSATRAALLAGAVDFIEKPFDEQHLLGSIERALERERTERERTDRVEAFAACVQRLSEREREILDSVVEGMHNREIAVKLGISPRTVEVYKARMMSKLRVQRIPELMRAVLECAEAGKLPAPAADTKALAS